MATGGARSLDDVTISTLARSMSAENVESIAEGYLGIEPETIANFKRRHREDVEAFNRDIIRSWAYKPDNSGPDQVQKLASLLFRAAKEGSYIDSRKVEQILGVPPEGTAEPVKESDIVTLAEELRPDAEKDMKIEMAPWAKEYNVDMDKLYTNLHVDQIENQPTGPEGKKVEDYKELFNQSENKRGRGKRILIKGDPGIGKTTFSKKVVWDWAKGVFTAVSVVFFVSLKLVKPGDPIENVIIHQTPSLEGLSVTQQKLKDMLETFGGRFLIILDGFDEHYSANNSNEYVLRLLRGQKFRSCHVLLTSRPHAVASVEDYFHVVLQIQGFTKEHATEFASRVLKDKALVKDVLQIQCLNAGVFFTQQDSDSVFTCPILLYFICILTNNNEIDFFRREVTFAEICTRLLKCLYRRYRIRKGKKFRESKFLDVVKKVGELACEILKTNNSWLRRKDVMKEVGKEAFEYGFLIGRDDHRLMADETADIVIDFPHRTIQEFFAAFFYVKNMNLVLSTIPISEVNQDKPDFFPVFLTHPFSLHFCLWFLTDECNEKHFRFQQRQVIETFIYLKTLANIDSLELFISDASTTFQAVYYHIMNKTSDNFVYGFLNKLFSLCTKIKYLVLEENDPIQRIMKSVRHLLPQLSVICLYTGFWPGVLKYRKYKAYAEHINIVTNVRHFGALEEVFKEIRHTERLVSLTFDRNEFVWSKWPSGIKLAKIHVTAEVFEVSVSDIPKSPHLTHLSICGAKVRSNTVSALCRALRQGKFPKLSYIDYKGSHIKGNLSMLLPESKCFPVEHLNLNKCYLNKHDVDTLTRTPNLRLKLMSLVLFLGHRLDDFLGVKIDPIASVFTNAHRIWSRHHDIGFFTIFEAPWPSLTELWLHELNKDDYKRIISLLNRRNFPKLKELGISMWKHVDKHKEVQIPIGAFLHKEEKVVNILAVPELEYLEPVHVEKLTHLTLHRFICTMQHLYMVTQSKILTQLHKLDISHSSGITGTLSILLCHSFPSLHTLAVNDCGLNSKDLCSLAQAKAKGRLPELKHLDVSENKDILDTVKCLFAEGARWENLESLNFLNNELNSVSNTDFEFLIRKVHSGGLGALTELKGVAKNTDIFCHKQLSKLRSLSLNTTKHNADQVLHSIFRARKTGFLPSLQSLSVVSITGGVSEENDHLVKGFANKVQDILTCIEIRDKVQNMALAVAITKALEDDVINPACQSVTTKVFGRFQELGQDFQYRKEILSSIDYSKIVDLANNLLPKPLGETQAAELIEAAREFCEKRFMKNRKTRQKPRDVPAFHYTRQKLLKSGVYVPLDNLFRR